MSSKLSRLYSPNQSGIDIVSRKIEQEYVKE
jgi:hypothetical protein